MKTSHSGSRTIIILQLFTITLSLQVMNGCLLLIYGFIIFFSANHASCNKKFGK